MKILLANYRYFISGGPERYLFNLLGQLEDRGHQVIPFSIDYVQNQPTPYSTYFVEPLGDRHQIYYEQHTKSPFTYARTISRLFYSYKVEHSISQLITDTKPDISFVLHYLRKLSPALLVGIKKQRVPLIVRLSDFMMLCPQAHCLRDNTPCTLCCPGNLLPSWQYKCVKDSQFVSLLNILASWYHRKKHFFDLIDAFVCTNRFMYNMMLDAGYSENRLNYIPTFTDLSKFRPESEGKKADYFIYVGRITHLKGLHVLLQALGKVSRKKLHGTRLLIAGAGDEPYLTKCKNISASLGMDPYVEFLGEMSTEALTPLLNRALFSVVPSLSFENLPNSLLESFACGTPVLASNIGSLQECVQEGKTGYLFEPGNTDDLAEKIEESLANPTLLQKMGMQARQEAEMRYSPQQHITSLFSLFEQYI